MKQTPLRNEAFDYNTKEAFRCLRHWQIFRSACIIAGLVLFVVLVVAFSIHKL